MVARRRGAIVLMSSLAGLQGAPRIATYAASKAFTAILAEGLWHELRAANVHVLASCAGAIRTPGYAGTSRREAPGILDADTVARETLAAIGRGPRVIPGLFNRVAAWFLGRVLPRRWTVAIMATNTEDLSQ
jgi:short-subunit dehydrogenase